MYRMNGYVQDKVRPGTGREGALGYERYTAGAGRARAVPVSFAHCISTCMGAEVARYLSSGLAVNISLYALARHPCRSRS
jgi:hypothetical protein